MCERCDLAARQLAEWVGKQRHDRCWYYPDIFRALCQILAVPLTPNDPPVQVPLGEFRKGCTEYTVEEYGPDARIAQPDGMHYYLGRTQGPSEGQCDVYDGYIWRHDSNRPVDQGSNPAEIFRIPDEADAHQILEVIKTLFQLLKKTQACPNCRESSPPPTADSSPVSTV